MNRQDYLDEAHRQHEYVAKRGFESGTERMLSAVYNVLRAIAEPEPEPVMLRGVTAGDPEAFCRELRKAYGVGDSAESSEKSPKEYMQAIADAMTAAGKAGMDVRSADIPNVIESESEYKVVYCGTSRWGVVRKD